MPETDVVFPMVDVGGRGKWEDQSPALKRLYEAAYKYAKPIYDENKEFPPAREVYDEITEKIKSDYSFSGFSSTHYPAVKKAIANGVKKVSRLSKVRVANLVKEQQREIYKIVGSLDGTPSTEKVLEEMKRQGLTPCDKEDIRDTIAKMGYRRAVDSRYQEIAAIVKKLVEEKGKIPTTHAVCKVLREKGENPSFIEVRNNVELAFINEQELIDFQTEQENAFLSSNKERGDVLHHHVNAY